MLDSVIELSGELEEMLSAPTQRVDPRTIPVRFSRLKHMSRSALHYYDSCQSDRDDTLAMRLGRGAHAMTLGNPVTLYPGKTRNGKVWDKFKEDNADKEILIRSEWNKSEGLAQAIRNHPIAAPLMLGEGTILEQQIEWEWMGRKCTSRPDSRRGSAIVTDLKTTQCAEPQKFARDAMWQGYHAQLAFYEMAIEHSTGNPVEESYVVAVESKRPYAITVLKLTDEAREMGRRLCRIWFERLLVCEQSNSWPAYSDAIVALDLADSDIAITIDGEDAF